MLYYLILAFMIIFPFFYHRIILKNTPKQTAKNLLPKPGKWTKEFAGSIKLFLLLFSAFIILSIILQAAGINDLHKVDDIVGQNIAQDTPYFMFSIIIVVLIEEFFFRAFLQKAAGIIPSTILFALAHYTYGSIAEIIGVFALGLILAYWYKKHNSLMQNYMGHFLYNAAAIILYACL